MNMGAVREPRRGPRHLELAERRRREIRDVRHPLAPDVRIDRVLVGPTGVHVVTPVPAVLGSSSPLVDAALVTVARTAADLVSSVLPPRYRDRVRPVLCRADAGDLAENVDGVLLTSGSTLQHILAASPPVLSTSEINDVALRLDARLEPFPAEPTAHRRRRGIGRAVAAGLAGLAVTAVAAAQASGVLPLPW